MTDKSSDKVYWLTESEEDKPYCQTTWFRSMKIQEFVELVEKESKIVGVIFSGNNIGFVLDDKSSL